MAIKNGHESDKLLDLSLKKNFIYGSSEMNKDDIHVNLESDKSSLLLVNKPNDNNDLNGWNAFLERHFKLKERGSNIITEIRAGTVAFLTLAYIILLNPKVLEPSGIKSSYSTSGTCIASCIASLIVGIFGNLPVGCGPGVGLSAYFSYGMIPSMLSENKNINDAWINGLSMCFISGLIVLILTLVRITPIIVKHLPESLKIATIVGMGLLLAFIGLVDINLVVSNTGDNASILELGNMGDWLIWLALFNTALIGTLKYFKINGELLICIFITTIIYFIKTNDWPNKIIGFPIFLDPYQVIYKIKDVFITYHTLITSIISFCIIIILDVSGVTYGIGRIAGLIDNETNTIIGSSWALIGASIGTIIASLFGCSPIIICIETSSGAVTGGRTGLTAIVIGLWFGLSIFFAPLFSKVPACATSPVLIFIGTIMMNNVKEIPFDNMRIAIPCFLTIVMMPFTYSISNGLFFGVGSYIILNILTLRFLYNLNIIKTDFDTKLNYSNRNIVIQ